MTGRRGRILVLDGDQAAALAVVRSLGRKGFVVEVADCVAEPLAGSSRHAAAVHRYPAPKLEADAFLDWLAARLRADSYELVIPITDDSLQPIARARERFAGLTKVAVAPEPGLEIFTAKDRTLQLAREVGVPVPEGPIIETEGELEAVAHAARYPLVVKPARSVVEGEGGLRSALSVRYAMNRDEVLRLGREALKHGPLLLQEYAGGDGVGVEVLCDRGEVLAAFQHRRLHEWPLTGGGSSYRVSEAVDPILLDDARRLMNAAGYHGVAMVEFKHDAEQGRRVLMEVNARFWGSLPLCTAAGADFPLWLRDLLVEGKRPATTSYRVGIRCRKLARDLFWAIEVLRRTDPDPLIRWPARHLGLTSWLGVLLPRHRFDVQSFGDMKPGLIDLRRSIGAVFDRFFERRRRLKMVEGMRKIRRSRGPLAARIKAARKIVVLCYGNINRSAIAAADLRARLAGQGVEVIGAGLHQREGRPADPRMLPLLAEVGIDLSAHRSHRLRAADLEGADLVFAMDASQLMSLRRDHPEVMDRVFLYGVLDDDPAVEVADPYGGDEEAYRAARDRLLVLGQRLEAHRG